MVRIGRSYGGDVTTGLDETRLGFEIEGWYRHWVEHQRDPSTGEYKKVVINVCSLSDRGLNKKAGRGIPRFTSVDSLAKPGYSEGED